MGEWGFSALVKADGRCVLFDAGRFPDTVLRNAESLGVDLSCATDVVLSHFHFDHTTGLVPLLEDLRKKSPDAMRRIHVAKGFFLSRRGPGGGDEESNGMIAMRETLRAQPRPRWGAEWDDIAARHFGLQSVQESSGINT